MNKINTKQTLIKNFSPNMLKLFDQCQTKFFLKYIQKLSLPQRSKIFEKGKKIHALANYCLNGQNIEKMENALTSDEKTTWECLKSNRFFNMVPFKTEYTLSCKIDDYWIGGRIDAIVKDAEDFYILDYKTGEIPSNAEYDFQTIIYLLVFEKYLTNKNFNPKSILFTYLGLKKGEDKTILLSEELKKLYIEKIKAICKKINLALISDYFEKSQNACQTCEYKSFCNN